MSGSWVHLLVGWVIEPIGKFRKIIGQAAPCSDCLDDLKLWSYMSLQWFAQDCNFGLGKLTADAGALFTGIPVDLCV